MRKIDTGSRSLAEGGVPCDANSPLPVGPKRVLSGGHVKKSTNKQCKTCPYLVTGPISLRVLFSILVDLIKV